MKDIRNKRVMLLVPLLDQGGLERICALTAQLLKDKCRLTLVVFSTKGMIYDVDGVDMIDLNLGARPGKIAKIFNLGKRIRAIKKIKREREIEVTYSFGPSANLANVFSRVKDKIWVGIRGYGALGEAGPMRRLCKRADKVICCSKVMEEDVKRLYCPKDTACLYNPCDVNKLNELAKEEPLEYCKTFLDTEDKVIVSMGREHDVKGFWHLLKAFSLVKKERPDTRLMIIGEGQFGEYKKLAEDLGVEESVFFSGVLKNPFSCLKRADLYVLTSVSEGFPNALVEAMAMGLPALSVNCKSGPAEIFGAEIDGGCQNEAGLGRMMNKDFEKNTVLADYMADNTRVYPLEYGILLPVINANKNLQAGVIEPEEEIMAKEILGILADEAKMQQYCEASIKRSADFSVERYTECLVTMLAKV